MNFYYGLIDTETNTWGFVEETDPRVTEDMIYLTQEEWQELLKGQSQGLPICYYNGRVFNAEPGRYYLDENGWHKRTNKEFNEQKAKEKKQYLVNRLYEIKANKAYGGVIINNLLVFETNQTAITNTVASLALMGDEDTAAWKFYTITGIPHVQQISKLQLAGIAKFGQNMINQCFLIEGTANTQLEEATTEQLNNEEWVIAFEEQVQTAMDAVNNNITINFS